MMEMALGRWKLGGGLTPRIGTFQNKVTNHLHLCDCASPLRSSPSFRLDSRFYSQTRVRVNCGEKTSEHDLDDPLSTTTAYSVLGVEPNCSATELKDAFRAKVKQFHPDVNRDGGNSDAMIRRVIQAYEGGWHSVIGIIISLNCSGPFTILSNCSRSEIIERECLDPFDNPECEAFDLFVNEVLCVGKGCPYSCVARAPHAFTFSSTGTARAVSQGHGEDYQVQLAVGQCPRSCIHYVTPYQRIVLEELLESILDAPYDTSAEAKVLYALIVKAKYENNRYQKPKKQPKASSQHVDLF